MGQRVLDLTSLLREVSSKMIISFSKELRAEWGGVFPWAERGLKKDLELRRETIMLGGQTEEDSNLENETCHI